MSPPPTILLAAGWNRELSPSSSPKLLWVNSFDDHFPVWKPVGFGDRLWNLRAVIARPGARLFHIDLQYCPVKFDPMTMKVRTGAGFGEPRGVSDLKLPSGFRHDPGLLPGGTDEP